MAFIARTAVAVCDAFGFSSKKRLRAYIVFATSCVRRTCSTSVHHVPTISLPCSAVSRVSRRLISSRPRGRRVPVRVRFDRNISVPVVVFSVRPKASSFNGHGTQNAEHGLAPRTDRNSDASCAAPGTRVTYRFIIKKYLFKNILLYIYYYCDRRRRRFGTSTRRPKPRRFGQVFFCRRNARASSAIVFDFPLNNPVPSNARPHPRTSKGLVPRPVLELSERPTKIRFKTLSLYRYLCIISFTFRIIMSKQYSVVP